MRMNASLARVSPWSFLSTFCRPTLRPTVGPLLDMLCPCQSGSSGPVDRLWETASECALATLSMKDPASSSSSLSCSASPSSWPPASSVAHAAIAAIATAAAAAAAPAVSEALVAPASTGCIMTSAMRAATVLHRILPVGADGLGGARGLFLRGWVSLAAAPLLSPRTSRSASGATTVSWLGLPPILSWSP